MFGQSMRQGFAALGVRNYRLFWTGQIISRVGTWMQQVSLPWLVLALGGSPIELALVAALEFAPALLLAPFGGVYADRVDKRRALFVTQSLASTQVAVLLILILTQQITIPLVMVMSVALGVVNAIDAPLRQSLPADLVPRNILPNAIALNSMAFNGGRVIGPAVAGVTIALGTSLFGTVMAGVAFNLAINLLSFAAVLIALWLMDPSAMLPSPRSDRTVPIFSSLREGVAFATRTPIVLCSLILLACVSTFGINFRILIPLFTQDVLRLGADAYGMLYAALGLGAVSGALTLAFLRERRFVGLMIGGAGALGVALLGLSLANSAAAGFVLLAVAGFSQMLMMNTVNATIQSNVSDELRGRILALYVMINQGSTPVGGLISGALVERWSVPAAFLVGATVTLGAAAAVWARLGAFSRAGRLGISRIGTTGPAADSQTHDQAGASPG